MAFRLTRPARALQAVPAPVLTISVQIPEGVVMIDIDTADMSDVPDPVAMLLGWLRRPFDPSEAEDLEMIDRLTDLQSLSNRLRGEVAQVIHATALVAALELFRRGFTTRNMAYYCKVSPQAFAQRFGTDKEFSAMLASGGTMLALEDVIDGTAKEVTR